MMAAVAHDPKFAKKVGISQSVGKDFNQADKGTDIRKEAEVSEDEAFYPKDWLGAAHYTPSKAESEEPAVKKKQSFEEYVDGLLGEDTSGMTTTGNIATIPMGFKIKKKPSPEETAKTGIGLTGAPNRRAESKYKRTATRKILMSESVDSLVANLTEDDDSDSATDTSSDTASDTSTETSTKTSTDAYTQGNITVTGGAGAGATSVTVSIPRGDGGDPARTAGDAKTTKKPNESIDSLVANLTEDLHPCKDCGQPLNDDGECTNPRCYQSQDHNRKSENKESPIDRLVANLTEDSDAAGNTICPKCGSDLNQDGECPGCGRVKETVEPSYGDWKKHQDKSDKEKGLDGGKKECTECGMSMGYGAQTEGTVCSGCKQKLLDEGDQCSRCGMDLTPEVKNGMCPECQAVESVTESLIEGETPMSFSNRLERVRSEANLFVSNTDALVKKLRGEARVTMPATLMQEIDAVWTSMVKVLNTLSDVKVSEEPKEEGHR
jgi:predicted amidophosphoribosyltransferase